MTRPRPASVRIVPIAGCVVRFPENGPPLVGVALAADHTLPRYFPPAAWFAIAEYMFGAALAQRFPT